MERDHYNADGEELRRLLAVRGIMYDRLKRSSDAHSYALNEVGGRGGGVGWGGWGVCMYIIYIREGVVDYYIREGVGSRR